MPYKDPQKRKEFQKKYHDGYDRKYYKRNAEKCRKYTRNYLKNVRRPKLLKLKQRAIDYKGGKCSSCGGIFPNVCYDFHHIDRATKYKEISCMITELYEWKDIKAELDKCILVCANCHRIIEKEYNENI
jgi:hypothetical protein